MARYTSPATGISHYHANDFREYLFLHQITEQSMSYYDHLTGHQRAYMRLMAVLRQRLANDYFLGIYSPGATQRIHRLEQRAWRETTR
jgi:hypothetical protein